MDEIKTNLFYALIFLFTFKFSVFNNFINMFAGYFLCPKCNVHGDWSILEKLVKKVKTSSSIKDFIDNCNRTTEQFYKDWQTIVNTTTSLAKINELEFVDLFRLFEFPVSINMSHPCLLF